MKGWICEGFLRLAQARRWGSGTRRCALHVPSQSACVTMAATCWWSLMTLGAWCAPWAPKDMLTSIHSHDLSSSLQ